MGIFSTREVVSFIYILLFVLYALSHKKIRESAFKVIQSACTPKLVIPFIIMLLYSSIIVVIICKHPLWDWIYIKDIAIWVLFAGVPVCFNAVSHTIEEHYFRHMITRNLKFTVLVEFFTGTFTFSLFTEFILQPIMTFLVLLQVVSETKESYKSVYKLLNWVLAIIGFSILGFTIKTALESYESINGVQTIVSFCLPLFLSVLYLPIAHIFAVYSKYETLFLRMSFKEPHDKKLQLLHRCKVILVCKLSYHKICYFTNEYLKNMYVTMENTEFNTIISNFKEAHQ